WDALPGTRREAEILLKLLPGLKPAAEVLLGSDASEQRLITLAEQGKLKSFRLLHLATHGEANTLHPEETALILAQDRLPRRATDPVDAFLEGRKPLDGRLTVGTILQKWQLDADLVVLSACQSGSGLNASGEGMV